MAKNISRHLLLWDGQDRMLPAPSGECTGPAEKDSAAQGKRRETNKKEERKQRSNCDSSECIFLFFYKYPLKLMTIVKRTAIITGTVKSIQDKGRYSDDR